MLLLLQAEEASGNAVRVGHTRADARNVRGRENSTLHLARAGLGMNGVYHPRDDSLQRHFCRDLEAAVERMKHPDEP
jgi:hypothetical protein